MMKTNRLTIVIDTNVLLVSISSFSKYHWIFKLILEGKINVPVSTEIFQEYSEKLTEKLSPETAKSTIRTLIEFPNVIHVEQYYHFNLIKADVDDNKFVDCAIAGRADFLLTNDKHFNILNEIEFPKVKIINVYQFQELYPNLISQ